MYFWFSTFCIPILNPLYYDCVFLYVIPHKGPKSVKYAIFLVQQNIICFLESCTIESVKTTSMWKQSIRVLCKILNTIWYMKIKINKIFSYCETSLIWSEHFNSWGKVLNSPIVTKVKLVIIKFVRLCIRVNTKWGQLNLKDICNWYKLHWLVQWVWGCFWVH